MSDDGSGLLTLHEAADRLGVHYMTVYRRVRLGMLPARKVGGTWRIDPVDLTEPGSGSAGSTAAAVGQPQPTRGGKRRRAPWPGRLRERMLAGDAAGSWQVVEAAMASGVEPADVYVEILAPALHAIGAGWEAGSIPIEREHLASGVATAIVGRLGPRFRRPGRHLGSVIVAMPAGERHGLGVAMLSDIVAQAGYDVLNIGADTPPASLASAIRSRDDLRAVVISVVDASNLPAAARLIAAARSANRSVLIVAGGFAVPDLESATRIGADEWAVDPRRLPALIAEHAGLRA
jgi:MerR family transcriptional regulator, light-induced transcriptional regulator